VAADTTTLRPVTPVAPLTGAAGDMTAYLDLKRELVGALRGRVLEIGAGSGANFGLLGRDVTWTGLEPRRRRRRGLEERPVIDGVAEDIPLPDGSVDAVLATTVLCSVRSQEQALAEVVRVLRPGGRFVFFEHVAAPDGTWQRRWQSLIAPCSRFADAGCDPSRETWRAVQRAGFGSLRLEWFARGSWPFIGGQGVK
jgi:ubiquinone/menaquinone biosynthesis C-methylase UbiE